MKYRKHDSLACEAPICMSTEIPYDTNCIWYPGEKICTRVPYTQVQKIQKRIYKLLIKGKLKYFNCYYNKKLLENIKVVNGKHVRGVAVNSPQDYQFNKRYA